MADLFEITLANGIPVEGDGNVKTINALMEDGALATVGHQTDSASPEFGANPATLIAVMKQISKTLQDLRGDWPASLGSGGGLKVESSNNPINVSGSVDITYESGQVVFTTFTCGTTAYLANDVVGTGGSSAVLTFAGFVPTPGLTAQIETVVLDIYRNSIISGETSYRLYLYSGSPPSALADSSPMDIPAGDRSVFLGHIDIPTVELIGSTVHTEVSNINKIIKTTNTVIYGYLVTKGPYNPTAAMYKVSIGSRAI